MMTNRKYLFNGVANGVTMTAATVLAEDGQAATTVSLGGGQIQGSDAHPHQGGLSARMKGGGASSQLMRLPFVAANRKAACSVYHFAEALPPGALVLGGFRTSAGTVGRFLLNTNGSVSIQNTASTLATSAAGWWQANRQNRFDMLFDNSGGVGAGKMTIGLFDADSNTPVGTPLSVTTADFGTADVTLLELGTPTSSASTWEHWFDSVQLDDGREEFIGPYVPVAPPTPATGPIIRWDGDKYIDLEALAWDGAQYVSLDVP